MKTEYINRLQRMPGALGTAAIGIGTSTANDLIGTAIGLGLEKHNDKRQLAQQEKLQNLQMKGNKEMTDYNMMKQLEMWKNTSYPAQMAMMKQAGLNPALMYGMSGGGGQSTGSANGNVSGASAPSGGQEIQTQMGLQLQGMQLSLLNAQKENIEADTQNKEAQATKTGGVDTENVKADTAVKIASEVIAQYTGKEAKDQYERIKAPNRGVEAKTYEDELSARQGIAGTIYELWTEGKLKEKSVAEITGILLDNAEKEQNVEKRRQEVRMIYRQMDLLEENIKGVHLDNILKDMDTKLQQNTGIDRTSPWYIKAIGRLFMGLFGK